MPLSLASGYTDGRWEVSDGYGRTVAAFYGPEAETNARAFLHAFGVFNVAPRPAAGS